ncbi:MAG: ribonuclease Z [Candidatus Muproteobacteria bacterium RBG_16_64_11]|uniref:Ribonuclease Z n=1 Tax=Candidatus Muproteobacteria bacterium RBG_16_64_11 TaxID=1817758 RepID=A0A1F6TCK2_9PROT|nr:MAG: ribonuclease Z [Candidatus Muproteobacteria bacterium RBG_16_64_11]
MKPLFHPMLVNDAFGDPGLYVDCLFDKCALLFDLGDIRALAARKLLRLTDVFVSHTHMDHFMGFDWLVRVCLGRPRALRLYGPPGFLAQVEHRLAAYTWNLVQNYEADFTLEVLEAHPDGSAQRAAFHCKRGFQRQDEEALTLHAGILREEEGFRVRAAFLDHKTACLGFALEENQHLNVWKNKLDELGLPPGPWLQEFKHAVRRGLPPETRFRAWWRADGRTHERWFALGALEATALRIVPGQKLAYVTDVVYHEANAARIVELARGADALYIEAPFLEQDAERAAAKYHLTAAQAGRLARAAGVKSVVPFHFSPVYHDRGAALRAEVERAFAGPGAPCNTGAGK